MTNYHKAFLALGKGRMLDGRMKALAPRFFWPLCMLGIVLCCVLLSWVSPRVEVLGTPHLLHQNRLVAPPGMQPVFHYRVTYQSWQNSRFIIEPFSSCVSRIRLFSAERPDGVDVPLPTPVCDRKVMDFAPYLGEGEYRLQLDMVDKILFDRVLSKAKNRFRMPYHELYVASAVFGGEVAPSLLCLGIFLTVVAMMRRLLRYVGLDEKTFVIFALGMAYYTCWLIYRPDAAYTNDVWGHIGYIEHMAQHWNHLLYFGAEMWHPPVYYWLMARAGELLLPSFAHPLLVMRLLSSVFFFAFIIYGLRTLALCIETRRWPYYLGVAMIVFWPLMPVRVFNITNDNALYAAWAAMFFYLLRWYRSSSRELPYAAIGWLGVCFLAKSGALIPAGILGMVVGISLLSRRIAWRALVSRRAMMVYGIVGLCLLVNMSRPLYEYAMQGVTSGVHLGQGKQRELSLWHFVNFYWPGYIYVPFCRYEHESGFLSYFLKSTLYGEFTLANPMLARRINAVMLAFTGLSVLVWLGLACSKHRRAAMPHVVAVVMSVAGLMGFMLLKRLAVTQDLRFCLPMVVAWVILYIQGIVAAKRWGVLLALVPTALLGMSIFFYLSQPYYEPTY